MLLYFILVFMLSPSPSLSGLASVRGIFFPALDLWMFPTHHGGLWGTTQHILLHIFYSKRLWRILIYFPLKGQKLTSWFLLILF